MYSSIVLAIHFLTLSLWADAELLFLALLNHGEGITLISDIDCPATPPTMLQPVLTSIEFYP